MQQNISEVNKLINFAEEYILKEDRSTKQLWGDEGIGGMGGGGFVDSDTTEVNRDLLLSLWGKQNLQNTFTLFYVYHIENVIKKYFYIKDVEAITNLRPF